MACLTLPAMSLNAASPMSAKPDPSPGVYPVKRVTERGELGPIDPLFGLLATRTIEVLVTHNEPVSCDDLACALGVADAEA